VRRGGTKRDAVLPAHRGPLAASMRMGEVVFRAVRWEFVALACARWRTIEFCEKYDGVAFDPAYPTRPLEHFEQKLRRMFAKPLHSPYGLALT